jgi:hypothetical protein
LAFLGEDFNRWVFPICLILMVFLTVFKVYGRLMNCLHLKQYGFDQNEQMELANDGRYIIDQFKSDMLLQNSSNTALISNDYSTGVNSYEK